MPPSQRPASKPTPRLLANAPRPSASCCRDLLRPTLTPPQRAPPILPIPSV